MCTDMRVDMRMDMRIDMCVGMHIAMCIDSRIDMCVGMHIDMCVDMRIDNVCRHALRVCYTPLESPRRGGVFEYRHACTGAMDMPSAMADIEPSAMPI